MTRGPLGQHRPGDGPGYLENLAQLAFILFHVLTPGLAAATLIGPVDSHKHSGGLFGDVRLTAPHSR
jgi:hypothetical protein